MERVTETLHLSPPPRQQCTDHMAAVSLLVQAGVDVMREGLRPAKLGAVTSHLPELCGLNTDFSLEWN